ncbi:hypothetical protein LCGC14_2024620 [marine sediment metagenome]|uniref:Uncharacterized protein n=1 Tax=marine sediment metagenome TaxID=412755 RepID=A0A0F9FJ08_9ZZZZ|nr:hypothetical protein [bacterium]
MNNQDLGVPIKIKMKEMDGLIDSDTIFKILSDIKNGRNIFFPDLKFKVVGYEVQSNHAGMNYTLIISPTKNIKLEELSLK